MGFKTVKTVIAASKNLVDISFFPEDPLKLHSLAKKKGVTAVVDCGVAPGLCNILLGYHAHRMRVNRYVCLVGGLPAKPDPTFLYKAPFSPIDVIEEYTRPARLVEKRKVVVKEALSEVETVYFRSVGKLEAFNTDGLRTLIKSFKIPSMKEKTLRYPGHVRDMALLKAAGFFSKQPVFVGGKKIRPVDLSTALLFPHWQAKKGERELTVMRVLIEGRKGNKQQKYVYHILDKFDKRTGTSSMARTTGYTCTAAARLVLSGDFSKKGISPPEVLGEKEILFKKILGDLKKRKIQIRRTQ